MRMKRIRWSDGEMHHLAVAMIELGVSNMEKLRNDHLVMTAFRRAEPLVLIDKTRRRPVRGITDLERLIRKHLEPLLKEREEAFQAPAFVAHSESPEAAEAEPAETAPQPAGDDFGPLLDALAGVLARRLLPPLMEAFKREATKLVDSELEGMAALWDDLRGEREEGREEAEGDPEKGLERGSKDQLPQTRCAIHNVRYAGARCPYCAKEDAAAAPQKPVKINSLQDLGKVLGKPPARERKPKVVVVGLFKHQIQQVFHEFDRHLDIRHVMAEDFHGAKSKIRHADLVIGMARFIGHSMESIVRQHEHYHRLPGSLDQLRAKLRAVVNGTDNDSETYDEEATAK